MLYKKIMGFLINTKFSGHILFLLLMNDIYFVLLFSALLIFFLGFYSIIVYSMNYFRILLGFELMYVGLILFYIALSLLSGVPGHLMVVILFITFSAGEASLFLTCFMHNIVNTSHHFFEDIPLDSTVEDTLEERRF